MNLTMKLLTLGVVLGANVLTMAAGPTMIPQPLKLTTGEGTFTINAQTVIVMENSLMPKCDKHESQSSAHILAATLRKSTGLALKVEWIRPGATAPKNAIVIRQKDNKAQGDEGYSFVSTADGVTITANARGGAFYGTQTLLQLLPAEAISKTVVKDVAMTIPCVSIEDKPRFSWRAYMLDEGRNFKGKAEVLQLLDQMAILKMNVFHWHLVDDQGWRLEIKKYPKLTSIGSKRTDTHLGGWKSPLRLGKPHSGFYTQKDIREIVAYAAERNITIMPEIGMPGHASAMIAAYPELGTVKEPIPVAVRFGKHQATCKVVDPKVVAMLKDILDEVMELFPGKVIHIGGDEVRFTQWKADADTQAFMTKHSYKKLSKVQVHFTNEMSLYLESKGRRLMGWNEILGDDLHGFLKDEKKIDPKAKKSGLSKTAVVHFWKGSLDLAIRAARQGHDIVNSLHSQTYLDYGYGSISLWKAYHFEPIPKGLPEEYHSQVLGLGCQMWGEWIHTVERMELKTYPRIAAYASVGWEALDRKNYETFKVGLAKQLARWDILEIGYTKNADPAKRGGKKNTAVEFYNYNKVGAWTPKQIKMDFAPLTVDVTKQISSAGLYKVALLYTKGAQAIDVQSVTLLKEGKAIAADKHEGFSGKNPRNQLYKLTLKKADFCKGAKYSLKIVVKGSGGTNSNGDIKMGK